MIMKASLFATYIDKLLDADLPNLKTIRIGTKALSYWPYKFTSDGDAEETLETFRRINSKGIHVALMGHFNHIAELKTDAVKLAIKKVRETGTQIRTQSPLLTNINDDADMWGSNVAKTSRAWMYSILHVCCSRYWCTALFWSTSNQSTSNLPKSDTTS